MPAAVVPAVAVAAAMADAVHQEAPGQMVIQETVALAAEAWVADAKAQGAIFLGAIHMDVAVQVALMDRQAQQVRDTWQARVRLHRLQVAHIILRQLSRLVAAMATVAAVAAVAVAVPVVHAVHADAAAAHLMVVPAVMAVAEVYQVPVAGAVVARLACMPAARVLPEL